MDTSHNWATVCIEANKDMIFEDLSPEAKGDGVFSIDQSGRVILCNEACARYLGYADVADIIGYHAILFLPVSDKALMSQHPLLACARGEVHSAHIEGIFLRADGTHLNVRYYIERIWLEWGRCGAECRFTVIEA